MTNSITQTGQTRKVRQNLWQASDGAVIGYGALLAPGGYYFCFTCNATDCQHVAPIDEAWLAGDEPLAYDGDELIFASSADLWPDDYGLESYI